MNITEQEAFKSRAVAWLHDHFDKVNRGERQAVVDDLFAVPGLHYTGRESYADAMLAFAPVTLVAATATDPKARVNQHGSIIGVWLEATMLTATGQEVADTFPVWWLVAAKRFTLAGRPSWWARA